MDKTSRRGFLKTGSTAVLFPLGAGTAAQRPPLDGFQVAKRHALVREIPTPVFFEGMLLGNGDVGVCVTTRPDALGLHIGKEDSWDIRVSEDHYQHVLHFDELKKMWQKAGEEAKRRGQPDMIHLENQIDFLRAYNDKVVTSYRKPWPRPWPCGIVWLHWDSRKVQLSRQVLDPSNGLLTLDLNYDDLQGNRKRFKLRVFVSWAANHISVSSDGPAPIQSLAYYPHREREAALPAPLLSAETKQSAVVFSCRQRFPATAPTDDSPQPPASPRDSSFALCAHMAGDWRIVRSESDVRLESAGPQAIRLDVTLYTPRDAQDNAAYARSEASRLSGLSIDDLQKDSERHWKNFWSRSAVEFADRELEQTWYLNQYFLACCLREGKVAPGLFGNWTSGRIGTAWHGDYHMNYNTQQVFWGVFSSNHTDQHLPYVELCEKLLPMSERFAREKFGLPGAFFPHSAYPVPSQVMPYPALPWGYEVCETPWTVQSLWWHYIYTLDRDYLKRIYPIIRAAARFVAAFVSHGEGGRYHVIPTVSPENWGCTVDYRLNRDCIMDLALIEFLLDSAAEGAQQLGLDAAERERWVEIRSRLAPYPRAHGPFGEVWLDVPGAPVEYVYNVPVTLAPVFPGEQVGLGSPAEALEIGRRTAQVVRLEGGNDLVYQPLIRARLGMLDLDWFKREVRYCRLPNGVCNDRVRQVGGRYGDSTDPDFMMRMGVWTENLSLPAVLNECLMQSVGGVIRLFPNTRNLGPARFRSLRAAGAFLVSAAWDGRGVSDVSIQSEKGGTVKMVNPWGKTGFQVRQLRDGREVRGRADKDLWLFDTQPGETYSVQKAEPSAPRRQDE